MFPVNRYILVAVLAAFLFALGCSSTSLAPDPGAHEEFAPVAETSDSNAVALRPASVTLEAVYFDTDEAVLRIDTREMLKGHAQSLLDHPEWGVVTIDGHCDERGSDPYNQALGRRRAAAVESYLVAMGVPPARIATRTFGRDRPAVLGHDESAWSHNRRSELQVEAFASASL